jgi:hypothetical protein
MLWMFQRVNYGPLTNPKNKALHDLEPREWCALGPILVMTVVMGVVPNLFLAPMAPAVDRLVQRLHAQRPAYALSTSPQATAGRPATFASTTSPQATAGRAANSSLAAAARRAVPVTSPQPLPASVSLTSERAAR